MSGGTLIGSLGGIALGALAVVLAYPTGGASIYIWMGAMSIGMGIGAGIGTFIDPIRPDVPAAGQPEVFSITPAQEGIVISDLLGTSQLVGNLFGYWNNWVSTEVENIDGGPFASDQHIVKGYKYYLTWAVGLCMGPVDAIYTLWEDDKDIWSGAIFKNGSFTDIVVEGKGVIHFYWGTETQDPSPTIAQYVSTPPSGFRGLCYAVFDNWLIGTYNRCPTYKFVIRKTPAYTWNPNHLIDCYDYNGAHALYYQLTNHLEIPLGDINVPSFSAAADVLYGESHGLSILQDQQTAAQSYVEGILKHTEGVLQQDLDGKWAFRLIRADIPVTSLPIITEEIMLEKPKVARKSWIDTYNDIKVQYYKRDAPASGGGGGGGGGGGAQPDYYISFVARGGDPGQEVIAYQMNGFLVSSNPSWSFVGYIPSTQSGAPSCNRIVSATQSLFVEPIGDDDNWFALNKSLAQTYLTWGLNTYTSPYVNCGDLHPSGFGIVTLLVNSPVVGRYENLYCRTWDSGTSWEIFGIGYAPDNAYGELSCVSMDPTTGAGWFTLNFVPNQEELAYMASFQIIRAHGFGSNNDLRLKFQRNSDIETAYPSSAISATAGVVYFICIDGNSTILIVSLDDGESWTTKITPFSTSGATSMRGNGNVVIVIKDGVFWRSTDYGDSWTQVYTCTNGLQSYPCLNNCQDYFVYCACGMHIDDGSSVPAIGPYGGAGVLADKFRLTFLVSTDNGITWTEIITPVNSQYYQQNVAIWKRALS